MDSVALEDHAGPNEPMSSNPMLRYQDHNSTELINKSNGVQRVEHSMPGQKDDTANHDINGHDFSSEPNSTDSILKDRYGKLKQHGTIWEPPVVYINTELNSSKSSPVKHGELPMPEHRFSEHSRSCNSSPKSKKPPSCRCCHPDSGQIRHQPDVLTGPHHSSSSGHHLPFDQDCHQDVFYVPVENEERSSQYHMRQTCNCSSCHKGRVDPQAPSPHLKHLRRDSTNHETLRSLLPDLTLRSVSIQCS